MIYSGKFDVFEFEFGWLLGSGGFGCVYEVRYCGEWLVVKKFYQGIKNERVVLESFEVESFILYFSYLNIVCIFVVFIIMDVRCVIMEFVGERNL